MPAYSEVALLVAASVRDGIGDVPRVGPFRLLLDAHTDNVWRNYAVPDDGATPTPTEVAALVAAFRERDRTPRLEYVPAAAPDVEPALLAAGFVVEGRPPLMACRPGDLAATPAPDGIATELLGTDEDLLELAAVQNAAYGDPEPAGPHDVARLRRLRDGGGVVVAARDAGTRRIVGGGICSGPVDGVSELAAVATAEPYRGRGAATAVVVALATAAHAGGARLVWLEPAGEREAALYARAGFAVDGEKLWISLPGYGPVGAATEFDHGRAG
jgi:GNAT superfamily N-acetyltransferase